MSSVSARMTVGLVLMVVSLSVLAGVGEESRPAAQSRDWLVGWSGSRARIHLDADGRDLILDNGLVRRTIRISPNAATTAITNLVTGENYLRAVSPEAQVELNGKRYDIGGLVGQPDQAYLTARWRDGLKADPDAFQFDSYQINGISERLVWKRARSVTVSSAWPPAGAALVLRFRSVRLPGVVIAIHYEIYDGIPLLSKWMTIENRTEREVRLDRFSSEILRIVETESHVDPSLEWLKPRMTVVTDYSFGGMSVTSSNRTVHFDADPDYKTQVNYALQTPALLGVRPPIGPDVDIAPGREFTSFRTFELFHDNDERERQGLAIRRMFRILAPWSGENPLMMHLTSIDPKIVYPAIDQAAECGFEMVIISFGSHFDMEDLSEANIRRFREYREYANRKGLELGGYSLLASRRISEEDDVINPRTGRTGGAIFGNSPCLGSRWGIDYFEKIRRFITETGFNLLEHDGNYPGDVCASTTHPGHRGLADSQWTQYQQIAGLYRWARERGVYLNVPDNYFLAGSNKVGMGYRETNWSLPRAQQHVHARQNMYDGTWMKTPSMGWMFVPLVEYQGGGSEATIEPLRDHLADYEQHLANNLGYGVQACYRGPRLYDSPETKEVVLKWVGWFRKYRAILESDIIHLRRPDGQNLDAVLHVNSQLRERAMLVVYNPTDRELTQDLTLPLYYTGYSTRVVVAERDRGGSVLRLDREYKVRLRSTVAPHSNTWYVIREGR